jgi:TonB family protein
MEKPPEPEEVMEEPVPEEAPQEDVAEDLDAPPPGDLLGLDADGGAGGDQFGLVGRKGGRSLIGGGRSALLARFAWYTRIVREELEDLVRRYLDEHGGIPRGELQTVVKIELDEKGRVSTYKIEGLSGNKDMDRAVAQILETAAINEPPPQDMPKIIKLKISSQG